MTLKEQEIFENYLRNSDKYNKWYPIFTVMLWTGMRVGEITGLRWCDVDFEAELINVNHTLVYYSKGKKNGLVYAMNSPKTEAGKREIPMLPKVKEALLQKKRNQYELGINCMTEVDGYTDFIFVNRFGRVQNQGTLNKALRRIIRDCNYEILDKCKGRQEPVLLPKFSNHSLRHTFTTRMCEAGVNIKAMQEILGHDDAETTMDVYAEATTDLKRTALIDFAEYFRRKNMTAAI